jgi:hypothetical protein
VIGKRKNDKDEDLYNIILKKERYPAELGLGVSCQAG